MAGIRERARRETMDELLRLARQQLAEVGGAGLSLRAIAREMGLVSSAVYRYVASRDDLLTLLIIESYETLGSVAEQADASVTDRADVFGRWMAIARRTRVWAVENPADFGLIYGTPVPGYVAPPDTIPAALRFTMVLTGLLADAQMLGCRPTAPIGAHPGGDRLRDDLTALASVSGIEAGPDLMAVGLMGWSQMIGLLTLELGGHFHNVIADTDAWFDHAMAVAGGMIGLDREPDGSR